MHFVLWLSLVIGFGGVRGLDAPGLVYSPTRGNVWPKPAEQRFYPYVFQYNPERLNLILQGQHCTVLNEAMDRYSGYLRRMALGPPAGENEQTVPVLESVILRFFGRCEDYPYFDMTESYTLSVLPIKSDVPEASITSKSVWGILRGVETFAQLSFFNGTVNQLLIGGTYVDDGPRFSHRGLMIDTARHYLPLDTIKIMLTGMEANKMNVLHWHIVDDQSFPYQSDAFSELSKFGAYNKHMVYKSSDIEEVVDFARLRGIRVIPEFDTPGHTASWGKGKPGLLTRCYNGGQRYGPIDPSRENNYEFLATLWHEIKNRFHDSFFHLGGDEVDFSCWQSNPSIQSFMEQIGLGNNYPQLESYYIKRIIQMTRDMKLSPIVWQEVFKNDWNHTIDKSTMIHIWFGDQASELSKVTGAGYRALLSSCWYLDHFSQTLYAGGGDWRRLYRCEPLEFPGSEKQKSLVVGGEACMWGEYVDNTNIVQRVWPRASAAAERLWSQSFNEDAAARRLEEHVCRMRLRGVAAQPANGPSFCDL